MTDSKYIKKLIHTVKLVAKIIHTAADQFNNAKASETAASMAYYALFSLFPLLLFLITVGSYILEEDLIQKQIMQWVATAFPMAQSLITRNIESVIRLRGTVSIIALVGMLWAATNVFYIMTLNINRAFPEANLRGFVKNRLVALALVVLLVAFMIVTLFFSTISDVLSQLELSERLGNAFFGNRLDGYLSDFLNYSLLIIIVFLLYWWVPNTKVKTSAAVSGVIFTLGGWQITTKLFMWYLRSGFVHYELVYGSLGTIISLMLWLYLTSMIILFGAHLASAVDQVSRGVKRAG